METTIDLTGSHVALVTPLTPDRDVHPGDLERLVDRAIADGARGVLVAGTTGEGALLEPPQRTELTRVARAVVDASTSPVTLLASACGLTVADVDADVERLADAGADGVLVLAPHTYGLTPEELVELHLGVADRSPAPTLIYHLPLLTGSSLTPAAVRELAAHPRIAGLKDSSDDVDRKLAFVDAVKDLEDMALLTGHTGSLHQALAAGASGSITAVANLRQRQVVALHAAVATERTDEATEHQAQLSRLSASLKRIGSVPAAMKAALQLDGVIEERWCRPPLRSLPPGALDHVRTALLLR